MKEGTDHATVTTPLTRPQTRPTRDSAAIAARHRPLPRHHQIPEHRAAQAEHRPHRQIDPAGDQHERDAGREDDARRQLAGQRPRRGQRQEVLGQQAKARDERDEDDEQGKSARMDGAVRSG